MWAVVAAAPLAACSSEDSGKAAPGPDAGFGPGGEPFVDGGTNGGANGGEQQDAGSEPTNPSTVQVRLLHGIPNVATLRVCYDRDYVSAVEHGPLPPEPLNLSTSYATPLTHGEMGALKTGALTFHGPLPPPEDAGALTDDDSAECPRASLEAVLPLPFTRSMLFGEPEPDAGAGDGGTSDAGSRDAGADADSLADLSLLPTLESSRPVTLIGSGVALDSDGLDAFEESARQTALQTTNDVAAADLTAARARAQMVAQRGPMFVIADEAPAVPEDGAFALHVAHLIADVPVADGRVGDLRVCVTEGTVERPVLPVREVPGLRFRTRRLIGVNFDAPIAYRFRFFSRADFDAEDKGCATTSLAPVAQYSVGKGAFKSGHSYTLAVVGATAPAALCSPKESAPVVRAGCAGRDPTEVAAQVITLRDYDESD